MSLFYSVHLWETYSIMRHGSPEHEMLGNTEKRMWVWYIWTEIWQLLKKNGLLQGLGAPCTLERCIIQPIIFAVQKFSLVLSFRVYFEHFCFIATVRSLPHPPHFLLSTADCQRCQTVLWPGIEPSTINRWQIGEGRCGCENLPWNSKLHSVLYRKWHGSVMVFQQQRLLSAACSLFSRGPSNVGTVGLSVGKKWVHRLDLVLLYIRLTAWMRCCVVFTTVEDWQTLVQKELSNRK